MIVLTKKIEKLVHGEQVLTNYKKIHILKYVLICSNVHRANSFLFVPKTTLILFQTFLF
jgi:hypothetical protein